MAAYEYFFILIVTLAGPLALSTSRKLALYKRPVRLLAAIGLPLPFFILWDMIAAHRGYWNFNPEYITGIMVYNLPVEEVLFFIVIPFAALFTWESVKYFLRQSP
jgi:lycopene cyclase domain-containing protein